jgi:hypothetical protein
MCSKCVTDNPVRIGDASRTAAASTIQAAFTAGYLDQDEMESKISAILASKYSNELADVMNDIPDLPAPQEEVAGIAFRDRYLPYAALGLAGLLLGILGPLGLLLGQSTHHLGTLRPLVIIAMIPTALTIIIIAAVGSDAASARR